MIVILDGSDQARPDAQILRGLRCPSVLWDCQRLLDFPLRVGSRRPDSNRGPLHYEDAPAVAATCGCSAFSLGDAESGDVAESGFAAVSRVLCCPPVAHLDSKSEKRTANVAKAETLARR